MRSYRNRTPRQTSIRMRRPQLLAESITNALAELQRKRIGRVVRERYRPLSEHRQATREAPAAQTPVSSPQARRAS